MNSRYPSPEEAERLLREKLGATRQRGRDTTLAALHERSKSSIGVGNIPGLSPKYLRNALGMIEWGNTRKSESNVLTEEGADDPTFEKTTLSLTVEDLVSVSLDNQRLEIVHRFGSRDALGSRVLASIQLKMKRMGMLDKDFPGKLNELRVTDKVSLPMIGLDVGYKNPTIETEEPEDGLMVLDRVRVLVPPTGQDLEDIQRQIEEMNADEDITTHIGSWHDFQRWHWDSNPFNKFSVDFEQFPVPEELRTTDNIGTPIELRGENACVQYTLLEEMTSNGDHLMDIAILPPDVEIPEPTIAFQLPAYMTYKE